jgi:hypothetical protein
MVGEKISQRQAKEVRNKKRRRMSHDGYVDKIKHKHITGTQITESKQMNRKQINNNPSHSAAGCTHSGYETLLIKL